MIPNFVCCCCCCHQAAVVVFFSGCKYHNWCSCQNTNTKYNPKKLRPEKKGTVIWPAMFFEPLEKITTGKKGSKYEHHQSHFNLRNFLLGFFILQKQLDPNFCYCVSLSCFVWIYNHTVTIVSQKYQELCLISETILMGFLYFKETTC